MSTASTGIRALTVLLPAFLLAVAALAVPRPAAGALALRECTNAAWADYNSCLMETSSWWVQKGCDISFQAEYVRCWAKWGQDAGLID